jgi:hypothetical protein
MLLLNMLNWTTGTPLATMSFMPFAIASPGIDEATPAAPALTSPGRA